MADEILASVKQKLSIEPDETSYDAELIDHINSAFSTLAQLGVGPAENFEIVDASATWDSFSADPKWNPVKTYLGLKVKLIFDPPGTSFGINAIQEMIKEIEVRLNLIREETDWIPPVSTPTVEPEVMIIPSKDAWYAE